MAFSISDVLAIIQNGVTAVNNLNIQVRGSLNAILNRFVADEANITTNTTNITALQANAFLMGLLSGLTLSTAGGSGTFGIAAGAAANSTATSIMNLSSAYTKTTSAWAVGTGNGGLDTGAIANSTWYHVHLIKRVDTNVVDVLFSTSATAPTMPTNYTLFRRIGSMRTDVAAQWTLFSQAGDEFLWDVPLQPVAATNPGTAGVTRVISTPLGVKVTAILSVQCQGQPNTNGELRVYISSLDTSDLAVTGSNINAGGFYNYAVTATTITFASQLQIRTDTSAQIRTRNLTSDANTVLAIDVFGWIDARGKNG